MHAFELEVAAVATRLETVADGAGVAAPAMQPGGAAAAGAAELLDLAPAIELEAAAAVAPALLPAKGLMVHCQYIGHIMNVADPKTFEIRRNVNKKAINCVYIIGSSSRGCFAYGSVNIGKSIPVGVAELMCASWFKKTKVSAADIQVYADDKDVLHAWPLSNPVLFATPVPLTTKMGVVKWRCMSEAEAMVLSRQSVPTIPGYQNLVRDLLSEETRRLGRPRKRARANAPTANAAAAGA